MWMQENVGQWCDSSLASSGDQELGVRRAGYAMDEASVRLKLRTGLTYLARRCSGCWCWRWCSTSRRGCWNRFTFLHDVNLTWFDEDTMIWWAGKVFYALNGSVVLSVRQRELNASPFPSREVRSAPETENPSLKSKGIIDLYANLHNGAQLGVHSWSRAKTISSSGNSNSML
jgi:hypothetical protein